MAVNDQSQFISTVLSQTPRSRSASPPPRTANPRVVFCRAKLRNAETMGAFHRCLEEAGVPWHSVNFPGRESLSPQRQQQSAEGTSAQEDAAAAADAPTLPRKSCASDATAVATDVSTALPREACVSSGYSNRGGGGSYRSSRGGGGTSEEASSGEVSASGASLEGGSCLRPAVSQSGVSQPGISPPNGTPRAGFSPPDAPQREVLLQADEILQPRVVGPFLDTDAERTAKEDATDRNPPLFPGERGALGGGAGLASSWGGSGLGFWCHPGDLERVRFCVCGRGRGLVLV